jgi:hypothetical protein
MIIRNPQIAKEMLGVDETILARSEAFADYMNLFASGQSCFFSSFLSPPSFLPSPELSSIMDSSHATPVTSKKSKRTKKSKKSISSGAFDS